MNNKNSYFPGLEKIDKEGYVNNDMVKPVFDTEITDTELSAESYRAIDTDRIDLWKRDSKPVYKVKREYTDEEISQIKLNKWLAKHHNIIFNNAIESLDYSIIQNEDYRNFFIALCQDFENRRNIHNFNITNNIKNDPVKVYSWYSWVKQTEKTYNYVLPEKYIRYNEFHYAVWGIDDIFIVSDYYFYGNDGKLKRLSRKSEKRTKEYVSHIIRLFIQITKGLNIYDFDFLLWCVMCHIEQTVEISEFKVSPRNIYDMCVFEINKRTQRKPFRPKRNKNQKVYIEPGYTKDVYRKHIDYSNKVKLAATFIQLEKEGIPLTWENILHKYSLMCLNIKPKKRQSINWTKIKLQNGQTVYTLPTTNDNENGSDTDDLKVCLKKNEMYRLYKEMINDKEWNSIIKPIERKEHKEQNTETRKNHKEWMDKLKELMSKEDNIDYQYFCDLYKGIIELPKRKTFNDYKRRLKCTSHQVF